MPIDDSIYKRVFLKNKKESFKSAPNNGKGSVSNVHNTLDKRHETKREKVIQNINARTSVEPLNGFDIDMLKSGKLEKLPTNALIKIDEIMSSMVLLNKNKQELEKQANKELISNTISNLDKAINTCYDALKEVSTSIDSMSFIDDFENPNLQDTISQVEKGEENVSQADLEVVAALKIIGVDVRKSSDTQAGFVWEYVKTNENAIKLDGDKTLTFTEDQVKGLLQNYLNKPVEERGGVITANGLLKVFKEEVDKASQNLGIKDSLTQGQIKIEVEQRKKQYGIDSIEFKSALLSDPNYIALHAKKQALGEVFAGLVDEIKEEDRFSYSQELQAAIDGNPNLKGRIGRKLSSLESKADNIRDKVADIHIDTTDKVAQEYDKAINILRTRGDDPAVINQIKSLQNAKQKYLDSVDFQREYIEAKMGDNPTSQEIMGISDIASGFKIERKDGELVDYMGSDAVAKGVFEALKENALRKRAEQKVQKESIEISAKESPDAFMDFINAIPDEDAKLISEIFDEELAGFLFSPGQVFDTLYQEYYSKPENKDKPIDDFIAEYADENSPISAEALKAGLIKNHPEKGPMVYANGQSSEDRRKDYRKQLVLLDLCTQGLSPEEVQAYLNNPSAESREAFLASKFDAANKKINDMSPEDFNKAADLAEQRLSKGAMKQYMPGMAKHFYEAESELSNGKKDMRFSKSIDKYIQQLGEAQEKNNEALLANGQKIVNPKLNPAVIHEKESENEEEAEQQTKNKKKTTIGDLYPSPPSLEKFLKKMKPYNGKELCKHFLEPLLNDIEKIEVNMDAYRNLTQGDKTPVDENEQVRIHQRNFEAMAFMGGKAALLNIENEVTANGNEGVLLTNSFYSIKYVLECLSSTDEGKVNSSFCKKNADGVDFRDSLRKIALDVCTGKYSKNPEELKQEIIEKAKGFGIPANEKDKKDLNSLLQGFADLSPEIMLAILEGCSTIDEKTGTVNVGDQFTNSLVAKVNNASNDEEKFSLVESAMTSKLGTMSGIIKGELQGKTVAQASTQTGNTAEAQGQQKEDKKRNIRKAVFAHIRDKNQDNENVNEEELER